VPEAGQEIEGFGGMRLRFVRIEPDVLEMEASYTGEAGMPPMHLHPNQAERFEILEGSMRTNIGNEEGLYEAGQVFEASTATAPTALARWARASSPNSTPSSASPESRQIPLTSSSTTRVTLFIAGF
jgi:hypothetical protein